MAQVARVAREEAQVAMVALAAVVAHMVAMTVAKTEREVKAVTAVVHVGVAAKAVVMVPATEKEAEMAVDTPVALAVPVVLAACVERVGAGMALA